MPNLRVKISAGNLPVVEVSQKVETLRDVRRLVGAVDKRIREVTRMFPAEATAKVQRVTISAE
jgi:hypothetical protein